jgi:hypothetical protein
MLSYSEINILNFTTAGSITQSIKKLILNYIYISIWYEHQINFTHTPIHRRMTTSLATNRIYDQSLKKKIKKTSIDLKKK